MPRGDWDDISSAQRAALRALNLNDGCVAENIGMGVRVATLRALHRYGLVRTAGVSEIDENTVVYITEAGRASITETSEAPVVNDDGMVPLNTNLVPELLLQSILLNQTKAKKILIDGLKYHEHDGHDMPKRVVREALVALGVKLEDQP